MDMTRRNSGVRKKNLLFKDIIAQKAQLFAKKCCRIDLGLQLYIMLERWASCELPATLVVGSSQDRLCGDHERESGGQVRDCEYRLYGGVYGLGTSQKSSERGSFSMPKTQ